MIIIGTNIIIPKKGYFSEETPNSDLDILVEFESGYRFGLLTFYHLENYLSDLLDVEVDLVMKDSLKLTSCIRTKILNNQRQKAALLEAGGKKKEQK